MEITKKLYSSIKTCLQDMSNYAVVFLYEQTRSWQVIANISWITKQRMEITKKLKEPRTNISIEITKKLYSSTETCLQDTINYIFCVSL